VQIQIAPGYTLSASGNSSASPQGFVTEELSPIQSPDAPTRCEICGLAHLDCDDKSNEIPAVQTLLGTLGLAGAVVTVDAMHCQKKPSSKLPQAAFI
jgi:hypothetical protein